MGGTLIFDGECGFCTGSRNLLARLDRHGRIRMEPLQRAGVAEQAGLTKRQAAESVWWVGDDGARSSSAEAINSALSTALGVRLPLTIYRLPGVRQAQEAIYQWVSQRRDRLPGTTPWCHNHQC